MAGDSDLVARDQIVKTCQIIATDSGIVHKQAYWPESIHQGKSDQLQPVK